MKVLIDDAILKKREKEKAIVEKMIIIYCKRNHKNNELCDDCRALLDYSIQRTMKCPFTSEKTFCSSCKVHCYKSEMKEKIKEVMKFSGKWLILYYPKDVIYHVYDSILNKLKKRK